LDGTDQIPVTIAGLQVSARRLRGRTGSGRFGDFCDVITLPAGRIGVLVGQVLSQQASGGMALARSVLRATANIESRPSQVLASLNRALLSWSPQEQPWLSGIYATVRPTRLGIRVKASLAGDQAALVRRSDGGVISLGLPGSRLGARADPDLADERCMLRSGDCLVLVTESVPAALGPSGAERLRDLVARLGSGSAARSVAAVLGAVGEQCRGRVEHDVVALAVKVPGNRRGTGLHASDWPGTRPYFRTYPALPLSGESPPIPDLPGR